jgi:CRISPR type III-B/RAMP module-associated protein Cmr5
MTRQQAWAKKALELVSAKKNAADKARYATLCMKTPMMLKQSGLVQTLSFLRARKKAGKDFVDDLALAYNDGAATDFNGEGLQREAQSTRELSEYLALSRDIQSISVWFRRFAQSELDGDVAQTQSTQDSLDEDEP